MSGVPGIFVSTTTNKFGGIVQNKINQHKHDVLVKLGDIEGIGVKHTGEHIIVATFLDRKKMSIEEVFRDVICHHLKGQSIKFKKPTKRTKAERFAPMVTTIQAVKGEETPPTLNLWVKYANDNDFKDRRFQTSEFLRPILFGDTNGGQSLGRSFLKAVAGEIILPVLSRSKFFQARCQEKNRSAASSVL